MAGPPLQANLRIALSRHLPVRAVSGEFEALLGFSGEDFLTSKVLLKDRIHPEDAAIAASLFFPGSKDQSGAVLLRFRHADGTIRILRAQFKKERSSRGVAVLDLSLEDVRNLSEPGDAFLAAGFKTLIEQTRGEIYVYVRDLNHVMVAASRNLAIDPDFGDPVGRTSYDILPEEVADIHYRLENQAIAEGRRVHQIQQSAAPGKSRLWIDNRKFPINGPEGEIIGILGVSEDVTSYVEAESKLRQSENLLHLFIEHAPVALAMFDREMRYMAVSRRWAEDHKMGERDMIGRLHYEVNPEVTEAWKETHRRGLTGEAQRAEEDRYDRADGTTQWIRWQIMPWRTADGPVGGIVMFYEDITERRRAEASLRESQEQLQLFIEHAPAALAMFDREMRYMAVSRRWIEMHSLLDVEVLGRSAYEVLPEIPQSWREEHRRCLAGEELRRGERQLLRANGTVQWIRSEIHPWRTGDGSVGGIAIFAEDVTPQKEIEDRLRLAATVFTRASEGIVITDPAGTILDVNEAFTRIAGYSREEVLGQNPRLLKSGLQNKEFYENMWGTLTRQGQWSGEIWNRTKKGDIYAERLTIQAMRDANGKVQQYVGHFTDITEIKERERQLEHMANFDALTGLPNRTLFIDRLRQAMAHEHRRNQSLAVAFFDLDGFKAINDGYGHATGDGLLTAVAFRMKRALREGDTLARLGGDEFAAVMLDISDTDACEPTLKQMLQAASQEAQIGDFPVRISASAGVALYPQSDAVDAEGLLRQASQSMYQAKLAGGNRYHHFDPGQDLMARSRHENLEHIRKALAARQFVLYYQPMVNMRTGEVVGAEALVRWQHPEQGLLPPGMFLPVIQDHPLQIELGEWGIEAALTQMESWQAQGLDLPVSVNVSALELQQPDFAERLRARLVAHPRIHPSRLELEVVETSALHDMVQSSQVLAACREIGVSVALDDFGTGYSSLAYLQRLPANILKIDQSFVRGLLDEPDSLTIIEGMMGLATAFSRHVVAEGVETVELGHMLLQIGCELGQGYGIARPMPAEEFSAWAAAWRRDPHWTGVPTLHAENRALLGASVEHRAWLGAFEACLQGKRAIPPPLDASQCRIGAWLNAERRSERGAQPDFQAIELLHRELHALAADIYGAKLGNRNGESLKRLRQLQSLQEKCLKGLEIFAQTHARRPGKGASRRRGDRAKPRKG